MSADETCDYLILPSIIDRAGVMPVSRTDIEMIRVLSSGRTHPIGHLEEIPEEVRPSRLL